MVPELPEVETVCRGLQLQLPGAVVAEVDVLRDDSVGYPAVEEFIEQLAGHRFVSVVRRGKYILINLDRGAGLACHLRMSGRLLVVKDTQQESRFLRVRIGLKDGRELRFEDMRVFGRLWYIPPGQTFVDVIPTLGQLGVEPLDEMSGELLESLFDGKKQPIKTALLDQRLIAGIGNIYADESLYQAGINPLRPAGAVKRVELDRLAREIQKVLKRAIKHRGSTLSDYRDSEGVNGNYQNKAGVYGREGLACRTCKSEIERVKIAGRSSHFCLKCQPVKAPRSSRK
ncbi:MAG TPA: bifunctional DNA-formamidopyrimidine glycosylase/DNA-(apurinic or apyrimidinic site) lyase [Drouetiella sp.]|jgi:formamidopyrimidine-DNA glycosylase